MDRRWGEGPRSGGRGEMKTDSLFYQLFRGWPAVALDLAGLDPGAASRYEFRSEELKQTAFRLDGVLAPAEESDEPWVFVEVQFQADETLYRRLFAEILLFLQRAAVPRPWRALVIYPDLRLERIPVGYENLLRVPELRRVDLAALVGQERVTPGWELLRLILDEPRVAVERARRLLPGDRGTVDTVELCNFIETVLVYKMPR